MTQILYAHMNITKKEKKTEKISCDRQKTTYQNLWWTPKAVLREVFIPINAYIKNEEIAKIIYF
jgi:hypothetical protein